MLKRTVLLLALCWMSVVNAADFPVSLPGHDDVLLSIPDDWSAQVNRPRPDLPPTIRIVSTAKGALEILITPIWPMAGAQPPTVGDVRSLVEGAARHAASQAVEKSLPLKEIAGPDSKGYYFFATDRQPEPGGYKYLAQGALVLRELKVTFTILVNGEPKQPVERAIEVLRTARRPPARNTI